VAKTCNYSFSLILTPNVMGLFFLFFLKLWSLKILSFYCYSFDYLFLCIFQNWNLKNDNFEQYFETSTISAEEVMNIKVILFIKMYNFCFAHFPYDKVKVVHKSYISLL